MEQTPLVALAVSLCCATTLYASSAAGVELEGQYVTLLQSGEYRMVQDGGGHRIDMEGFRCSTGPGNPQLPSKRFLIALPPGARVQSTELSGTYRIAPTPPPLPLAGPEAYPRLLREMNEEWEENYRAVYSGDLGYPEETGKLVGAGSLRKYSYACVSFCPFRYRPLSGRLVHFDAARVVIHYRLSEPGSVEAERAEELKWDTLADREAQGLFMNFEEMSPLYEPESSRPKGTTQTHD
jgi:hypothetical protein